MTKLVKLQPSWVNFLKEKGIKGIAGKLYVEIEYLQPLPSGTSKRSDDILNDQTQLPMYNLKLDTLGRLTTDYDSIHSHVPINCYIFENADSVVEVPDHIFDKLKLKVVEEVV